MPFKYVHNDYNGVIKSFSSEILFNYDNTRLVDSSWSSQMTEDVCINMWITIRAILNDERVYVK